MEALARRLKGILDRDSEVLVQEILRLGLERGFTDQTSSMRAAWHEAVLRLNDCLVRYLADGLRTSGLDGRNDYRTDPRFESLRDIARRHRNAGVPLELHHGLFRLFRRVYIAHCHGALGAQTLGGLPAESGAVRDDDGPASTGSGAAVDAGAWRARLDEFFDEADQAMLAPWAQGDPVETALADSIRRLTRERDQYFGALESLRGPVFIMGDDGTLMNANTAALQTFLGVAEAGALTYRLALQHQRAALRAVLEPVLAAQSQPSSGVWLQTHRGLRCFDIRLRRVEDSSYKLDRCTIILMHDVTEHLEAIEQARRAERTMSLFLAAMSHEIRGPLHSVLGVAELLRDAQPAEIERLTGLLDISARALNATLENVLSFSRFEHQAPEPRPETINLPRALSELVRVRQLQARHLGVPLGVTIDAGVPDEIRLDWSMTQQILGNLVQNALRHDDGQGVLISVSRAPDWLIIEIRDHGPGLPEEIGAMLSSVPAELRPRLTDGNGSGLGLAIAQRMTLAMGGRIEAVDTAGQGACLRVWLPLVHGSGAEQRALDNDATKPSLGKSCLLIDDDVIGAQGTVVMLERLLGAVDHACNLEQALSLCMADPEAYDFFIVDLRLPDGSGIDFARQVHEHPALRHKPVLLLSANIESVRRNPEAAGLFSALLEKPLTVRALSLAIRRGLSDSVPDKPLAGLSMAVQQRMAETFAADWAGVREALIQPDWCADRKAMAARAHKLINGAALFGLHMLAMALRSLERVCARPDADEGELCRARDRVLQQAPREDWLLRWQQQAPIQHPQAEGRS